MAGDMLEKAGMFTHGAQAGRNVNGETDSIVNQASVLVKHVLHQIGSYSLGWIAQNLWVHKRANEDVSKRDETSPLQRFA